MSLIIFYKLVMSQPWHDFSTVVASLTHHLF